MLILLSQNLVSSFSSPPINKQYITFIYSLLCASLRASETPLYFQNFIYELAQRQHEN